MGSVADAAVTLYTFPHSPFAQRVVFALEEKRIPYTSIVVADFANKPPGLVEANPIYKTVPTIIHNGKPVAESLVILQYLEDEWPQQFPLMPKDAHEKSKVRFWADYIYKNSENLAQIFKAKAGSPEQKAAHEASITILKTLETAMTGFSAEGPFFAGETFGFLDVVFVTLRNFIWLAEEFGGLVIPGPDELPRLHKYIEAITARPSLKAIPGKEETFAFFKVYFERRRAAAEAAAASK